MEPVCRFLFCGAVAAVLFSGGIQDSLQSSEPTQGVHSLDTAEVSPVTFEENRGQFQSHIRYAARGSRVSAYITAAGGLLVAHRSVSSEGTAAVLRLTPMGARSSPRVQAVDATPGRVHVFRGNDPRAWVRDIPTSRRVRVSELYPGIDVEYYGTGEHLEYDFVVAPGGDPSAVRLKVENATPRLGASGELIFDTTAGPVVQRPPVAYQNLPKGRRTIAAEYRIAGAHISFALGEYDHTRPLVIDPVLLVATYLGGDGWDEANAVIFGSDGLFITGRSESPDFPAAGPVSSYRGGTDAFVAKYSIGGRTLQYAVYYGGGRDDFGAAVAADGNGGVYVAGVTFSEDLPVAGPAVKRALGPPVGGAVAGDGFLAHLSSSGSLVLSTYFGSDADDGIVDLIVGADVYLLGRRTTGGLSDSFPIPLIPSTGNGFLFRLTRDGLPLSGRLIAGMASAVTVGPDGAPYIASTGGTASAGAFQPTPGTSSCTVFRGGTPCPDGFLARFSKDLANQEWGTYLREVSPQTDSMDFVTDIAVDSAGAVYAVGMTTSGGFPVTSGALQTTCGVCNQPAFGPPQGVGFFTKINSTGTALEFSTFLGGTQDSSIESVAVDHTGAVFVGGRSTSTDLLLEGPPLRSVSGPGGFVSVLSSGGTLQYSSWSAGSLLSVSRYGTVALVGSVSDGPTVVNAAQPSFGGGSSDGFLEVASIPRIVTVLDAPLERGTTRASSVTLRGFAVDTRSTSGAGIDGVHVYAYPQDGAGSAVFLGLATLGQSRSDAGEALGPEFTQSGFTLTVSLPPGSYLFVAYAHSSVDGAFGPPAQARATALSGPVLRMESPAAGLAPEVVTISGVALDLDTSSGTGVDTVHIWGYPSPGSGAAAQFLGVADYGVARADVGAAYGARFASSGFSLRTPLSPGSWLIVAYGRSTVSGSFSVYDSSAITVRASALQINFEAPTGPVVYQGFQISGIALDVNSMAGSGIDAIHAWGYPNPGSGAAPMFLGSTTTMTPRRNVAVNYGGAFVLSGFELRTASVPPGNYLVVVFARNAVTGRFDVHQTRQLEVRAAKTVLQIETPASGDTVPGQIAVRGFAFDPRAADGLGVDGIHVWVYPNWGSGAPAYFSGLAFYGREERADLGQANGTNFSTSGFQGGVTFPAGGGTHLVAVFAHSTVTDSFIVQTRLLTVPASEPILTVDAPRTGAIVGYPAHLAGWMIDRAAARLTTPLEGESRGGISHAAIYAYPNPGSGEPPIQVSGVGHSRSRPDVAAAHGSLFLESGFELAATGLSPGVYDLAFFGRSVISQQWNPPVVVRVTVQ